MMTKLKYSSVNDDKTRGLYMINEELANSPHFFKVGPELLHEHKKYFDALNEGSKLVKMPFICEICGSDKETDMCSRTIHT